MSKIAIPKGYFSNRGYEGIMPNGYWRTFDGEEEYHQEFWDEYNIHD